jgi:hypothetical protein
VPCRTRSTGTRRVEAVWKAEHIIFLGLHFHKQNTNLLKPIIDDPRRKTLGLKRRSKTAVSDISERVRATLGPLDYSNTVLGVDGDCRELFQEYQTRWSR